MFMPISSVGVPMYDGGPSSNEYAREGVEDLSMVVNVAIVYLTKRDRVNAFVFYHSVRSQTEYRGAGKGQAPVR